MSYVEMGAFGAVEPTAVQACQAKLIRYGFLTGTADGVVGPKTFDAAVKLARKAVETVGFYAGQAAAKMTASTKTIVASFSDARSRVDAAAAAKDIAKLNAIRSTALSLLKKISADVPSIGSPATSSVHEYMTLDLSPLGAKLVAPVAPKPAPAPVTVAVQTPVAPKKSSMGLIIGGACGLLGLLAFLPKKGR